MFCTECGANNADGAAFCGKCGAKLIVEVSTPKTEAKMPQQKNVMQNIPKPVIGAVVAVAVIIAIVVFAVTNRRTKVDLAEYYDITFDGISPFGNASVQVDYDGFEKKYSKVFYKDEKKSGGGDIVQNFLDEFDDEDPVFDNVDYTLEDSDGTEIIGNSKLSNGDTITLKISIDSQEEIEKEYKCKFTNLEKKFTVEGLGEYITECKSIDDENLDELKRNAEPYIDENISSDGYYLKTDINDMAYLGMLLGVNEDSNGSGYNRVYLIYKLDVSYDRETYDDNHFTGNTTIYYYVGVSDVYIDSEKEFVYSGSLVPYDEVKIQNEAEDWWTTVTIYGYESYSKLKEAIVDSAGADYEFDEDVDEDVKTSEKKSEDKSDKTDEDEDDGEIDASQDPSDDVKEIFPDSSESLLSDEDLAKLTTADEAQKAINEIYAREGYIFDDENIRAYWSKKYDLTIPREDFTDSNLSDIEIANKEKLMSIRDKYKTSE